MSLDLPKLQILEIDQLIPHEWHDHQRTPPLIERLRSSGFLRNPPIVTPFNDETNRYMVLDGANRTFALKEMGVPHIIAQVTESGEDKLQLKTWNHVLWEMTPEKLMDQLKKIDGLEMQDYGSALSDNKSRDVNIGESVGVETVNNKSWLLTSISQKLESRIEALNQIVNAYKSLAKMDRTPATSLKEISVFYENICAIIVFPHFEVEEILQLCSQGTWLPAGITRFTISPRALRLNYPLDYLSSGKSLEDKNQALEQWVQERIARKGVRVYSEATVLFDE